MLTIKRFRNKGSPVLNIRNLKGKSAMFNRLGKGFVLIALIFSLSLPGTAYPSVSGRLTNNPKAAAFTLRDQFGNELSFKFPREKITIFAFADKNGSDQLEDWIRPLVEKYSVKDADKIDIAGIAELSSVPGIAKGIVRNLIKKKSERSVLLDWNGDVSKSYNYEKDKANIILVDRQGNIISREVGTANAAKLAKIYQAIDRALR